MTNEEAIARIREHKIVHKMNEPRAIHISEALELAIKALEQETVFDKIRAGIEELPNANPSYWHGGDMVNRDDALEIIDRYERM